MTGKVRGRYTLEFTQEAVRLVKAGQTNGQVAKQTCGDWPTVIFCDSLFELDSEG